MDIVHRLHYLVLSQKSDLMTMEREQRLRVRRQSSLPEYSKANKSRQKLEQAYFNDVSFLALTTLVLDGCFMEIVFDSSYKVTKPRDRLCMNTYLVVFVANFQKSLYKCRSECLVEHAVVKRM